MNENVWSMPGDQGIHSASVDDVPNLVLGLYMVLDVSTATDENGADVLHRMNTLVAQLLDCALSRPSLADALWLAVIGVGDDTRVVLPLCDAVTLQSVPVLEARDGLSLISAFRLVRTEIASDRRRLLEAGARVERPVVMLVTLHACDEAEPEMRDAFATLFGSTRSTAPDVIMKGLTPAAHDQLSRLAEPYRFTYPGRTHLLGPSQDLDTALVQVVEGRLGDEPIDFEDDDAGSRPVFVIPDLDDDEWT